MELRQLMAEEPESSQDLTRDTVDPAQAIEQTSAEYRTIQKELTEIEILIKQSSAEVEKLAQRNAQLANKVRTMEANIDTVPRQDIKEVYTAAQEAQMRLFMMRGQVEQLQSRQENLRRFADSLGRVLTVADNMLAGLGGGEGGSRASGPIDIDAGIIKIIDAQENERQHLSNQLHDGPAQSLTNLILQAEICERLFDSDPARARNELTELKHAVNDTFQKVRSFIFDLRPMMLDDLGLNPTLKKSVEDYEQKTGIACNLTIFRIFQQSLNNTRDHAQAGHVQLFMDVGNDKVTASIEDDGVGFNVSEAMAASQQRKTIGLSTMKERIEMLGGELRVDSAPDKGTRIDFWLPVVA
jgi:two-component system sensor histidine kinase DegS